MGALQRGAGAADPRLLWTLGAEATRAGREGRPGAGRARERDPHAGKALRTPELWQWNRHSAPEPARARARATSASGCGNLQELRGFDPCSSRSRKQGAASFPAHPKAAAGGRGAACERTHERAA